MQSLRPSSDQPQATSHSSDIWGELDGVWSEVRRGQSSGVPQGTDALQPSAGGGRAAWAGGGMAAASWAAAAGGMDQLSAPPPSPSGSPLRRGEGVP